MGCVRPARCACHRGLLAVLLLWAAPACGAKYAGEFMRLGLGARSWAMGGASVATASDATAVYWNPAGLARVPGRDLLVSHAETFGALLNYDAAALALPSRRSERPLVVGFGLIRLGGGGIQRTTLANAGLPISDTNRVVRVGETVGHGDWALYAGLGGSRTDRLDLGLTMKLIYRDLVDVSAFGFGFDAGASFRLRPDLRAALVVRDLTTTLLAYDNGHKESVNPQLVAGAAYARTFGKYAVTATADGVFEFEHRREAAQFHAGAVSLDLRWGVEVGYRGRLALRGGMSAARRPTFGVGVRFGSFRVDGAWQGHDLLDDSYRFSLSHHW